MRTRAYRETVANATALGARVRKRTLFYIEQNMTLNSAEIWKKFLVNLRVVFALTFWTLVILFCLSI